MTEAKNIVYFDGVCGLCNKFVSFLLWADKKKNVLSFSPLQGTKAKELGIPEEKLFGSIIFKKESVTYFKSTAVLKILGEIGGIWKISAIGYLFPRVIRDWVYDGIARNRYSIFGKKDHCRMPTPSERKKFIME